MANPPGPQPQPNYDWVLPSRQPTQAFATYMAQLDATVRALASGALGSPTQLTNAANDAAAAAAGVPIGSIYRNGSVVQIRVT